MSVPFFIGGHRLLELDLFATDVCYRNKTQWNSHHFRPHFILPQDEHGSDNRKHQRCIARYPTLHGGYVLVASVTIFVTEQ
jgi:predicted small integral membrane protein